MTCITIIKYFDEPYRFGQNIQDGIEQSGVEPKGGVLKYATLTSILGGPSYR